MEKFARSLKHEDEAICFVAVEVNQMKLLRVMVEKIMFGVWDYAGVEYPHTNALVISARIKLIVVHRILVDNRSSFILLYKNVFDAMRLSEKDLRPCTSAQQVFSREKRCSWEWLTWPSNLAKPFGRWLSRFNSWCWMVTHPTTHLKGDLPYLISGWWLPFGTSQWSSPL